MFIFKTSRHLLVKQQKSNNNINKNDDPISVVVFNSVFFRISLAADSEPNIKFQRTHFMIVQRKHNRNSDQKFDKREKKNFQFLSGSVGHLFNWYKYSFDCHSPDNWWRFKWKFSLRIIYRHDQRKVKILC